MLALESSVGMARPTRLFKKKTMTAHKLRKPIGRAVQGRRQALPTPRAGALAGDGFARILDPKAEEGVATALPSQEGTPI